MEETEIHTGSWCICSNIRTDDHQEIHIHTHTSQVQKCRHKRRWAFLVSSIAHAKVLAHNSHYRGAWPHVFSFSGRSKETPECCLSMPEIFWSQKLSRVGSCHDLDGTQCYNTGCCSSLLPFFFPCHFWQGLLEIPAADFSLQLPSPKLFLCQLEDPLLQHKHLFTNCSSLQICSLGNIKGPAGPGSYAGIFLAHNHTLALYPRIWPNPLTSGLTQTQAWSFLTLLHPCQLSLNLQPILAPIFFLLPRLMSCFTLQGKPRRQVSSVFLRLGPQKHSWWGFDLKKQKNTKQTQT